MSTDDDTRAAQVASIMAGGQDNINRFLSLSSMRQEEQLSKIDSEGCARRCSMDEEKGIHPSIIASGISSIMIAAWEGFRIYLSGGSK
jgi:hypothetical protein